MPRPEKRSFRSFRFVELPTKAETGNCSVERPFFLSDHLETPCTEDGGNWLNSILNRAFELDQRGTGQARQDLGHRDRKRCELPSWLLAGGGRGDYAGGSRMPSEGGLRRRWCGYRKVDRSEETLVWVYEGRYKAIWKTGIRTPWRKAGLLKPSR